MTSAIPCPIYLTHVKTDVRVYCVLELGHDGMHRHVNGFEWPATPVRS